MAHEPKPNHPPATDDSNASDQAFEEMSDVGAPETEASGPPDQVARLQSELAEAQDRVLRVQADLENYRKRVRREREEDRKNAALPLLMDLLPVIDNLHRALQSQDGDASSDGVLTGVRMVHQQLMSVLAQHDCSPMSPLGDEFDPMNHKAIGQQPHAEIEAGKVAEVAQIGYRLNDRVIRPAHVIVSTGAQV